MKIKRTSTQPTTTLLLGLPLLLLTSSVVVVASSCGLMTEAASSSTNSTTFTRKVTSERVNTTPPPLPAVLAVKRINLAIARTQDEEALAEMLKIKEKVQERLLSTNQQPPLPHKKEEESNNNTTTLAIAFGIIEVIEGGYRKQAYNDGYGTMTVGFGSTYLYDRLTGKKRKVKKGDKLSEAESRLIKERTLREDYAFLQQWMKTNNIEVSVFRHMNSVGKAALLSFIYNIGRDAFTRSEVAKALVKGGSNCLTKVATIMKSSYITSGGVVSKGLKKRRLIESIMLLAPTNVTA